MASVRTSWENLDIYTATQALKTFGTGFCHHIGLKWQNLGCTMEIDMLLGPFTTSFGFPRCIQPSLSLLCHHISMTLYGTSAVDVDSFPNLPSVDEDLNSKTSDIESFNSEVWKTKKENGLSLNAEIEGMYSRQPRWVQDTLTRCTNYSDSSTKSSVFDGSPILRVAQSKTDKSNFSSWCTFLRTICGLV